MTPTINYMNYYSLIVENIHFMGEKKIDILWGNIIRPKPIQKMNLNIPLRDSLQYIVLHNSSGHIKCTFN